MNDFLRLYTQPQVTPQSINPGYGPFAPSNFATLMVLRLKQTDEENY